MGGWYACVAMRLSSDSTEGEAVRLPGGNTLHNYGSLARAREVTPEGEVVWDIGWPDSSELHRSTPLTLDQLYGFEQ